MERRKFLIWIVILVGSLITNRCSTVDVRREQACPMYGDLNLDFSEKKSLNIEGYNGIITVPADETTKAKAIDNKEALNSFLASYKSICGQEPPYYSEIAYVKRMKAEAESKKEEELQAEIERKKQEALARQKARKQTGLNLDALDTAIDSWLLLQQESEEFEKTGQTIKANRKRSDSEKVAIKIKNYLKVGQSISATTECPFDRIPIEMGGEGYATRVFKLSCFDSNDASLGLIFEFRVRDESWGWGSDKRGNPTSVQTKDSIAEIFEGGLRFTGSAQIVGEWIIRPHVVNHDNEPTAVELPSYDLMKLNIYNKNIRVKVKIISLQPVN